MGKRRDSDSVETDAFREKTYAMDDKLFPLTFRVLTMSGFWRPIRFGKFQSLCYYLHTASSFISIIVFLVTLIIDTTGSSKSIRSFIESLFITLTTCIAISKLCNIYLRRSNVINLLQMNLHSESKIFLDAEEVEIIDKSIRSERLICYFLMYMIIVNTLANALKPIVFPNPGNSLMIAAYTPCDRSHPVCFWFSYSYQLYGYVCTSMLQVSCDCLVFNFIDRICARLNILEHRISKLAQLGRNWGETEQMEYLKTCVKDHLEICQAIEKLNETFYEPVTLQFILSTLVICTNIYFLSTLDLYSIDSMVVFVTLCCVLLENLFYCWYGFKVTMAGLHISEAIFYMDWLDLDERTKKMLLFIMLRTSKGIFLFKNVIVCLSPESFVNIVKLSYSAFNILQRM